MTAHRPAFLITIDTEGDNLWSRPREITTRNSQFLPRFQELCEAYGLLPTYLVNHEMACCPDFREFGRDILQRGTGEIGMHLHAWNSPPLLPLTDDDLRHQPYLMEYPEPVMRDKIAALTDLLEETFETPMRSHRAGRWGLDATYARLLSERGYRVDCSVTPGVSWSRMPGLPGGRGGSDYTSAPAHPYYVHPDDVCRPGPGALLEVPMTTRPHPPSFAGRLVRGGTEMLPNRLARRVAERLFPQTRWLRPDGRNSAGMLRLLQDCIDDGAEHVEFMLHSSEFMPGGSPRFPTAAHIERLYRHLAALFEAASTMCTGMTLTAFAERYATANGSAKTLAAAGTRDTSA